MHARMDPPDELVSVAAVQGGVVSAEQLTLSGYPLRCAERLVNQRSWRRLATGLYHLGAGEPSWLGLAWGGVLLGGPEARLGFTAAGHLWEFVDHPPPLITVLVPHGRSVADRGPWLFRQERPGARSARSQGSPPRTTAEDTVLDLCTEADGRDLVGILSRAVQSRRTTAPRLARAVDSRARIRHRHLLCLLLTDVAEGVESPLELAYLRDVERAHGLPRARRQVRSRTGTEVRDMLYEELATVVELDGRLHIAGRFRDMGRDNDALLSGLLTLRYGWPDVTDRPCQVAWQVATLLRHRGWAGFPTRCRRCQHANEGDLASG